MLINGQPGLIGYLKEGLDGKHFLSLEREGKANLKQQVAWYQCAIKKREAAFVMVLTCTDNQVQEIDIIINPEKLRHIPALTIDDNGTIVC